MFLLLQTQHLFNLNICSFIDFECVAYGKCTFDFKTKWNEIGN